MIRGLNHVAISTGDLERAVAFYCDVLGFERVYGFSWEPGSPQADRLTGLTDSAARCAVLRLNHAVLELFEFTSPQGAPQDSNRPVCDHGLSHLSLDVTDIAAEYERLAKAGMRFHAPPMPGGENVMVAYGRDPDGNVIELQEIQSPAHPMYHRFEDMNAAGADKETT